VEGIDVYHFLSGAFRQCVSIAKVVIFYVFDVVTICDIHVTGEEVHGPIVPGFCRDM